MSSFGGKTKTKTSKDLNAQIAALGGIEALEIFGITPDDFIVNNSNQFVIDSEGSFLILSTAGG